MAKKAATKAATKGGQGIQAAPGGMNAAHKALLVVAAVALLPFSLPSLTLLFFGMLPTMAAAIVDRGPNRYAWLCVGGLNFSGLAPYLFDLWFKGHTMDRAWEALTDVLALLVIYGAASCGWLLYMMMPPVVAAFSQVAAQRRVAHLRATQRKLVEQWGPDVVHKDEAAEAAP